MKYHVPTAPPYQSAVGRAGARLAALLKAATELLRFISVSFIGLVKIRVYGLRFRVFGAAPNPLSAHRPPYHPGHGNPGD